MYTGGIIKPTTHRAIAVSSETDQRTRRVLDDAGRKRELSRFVEQAPKARLLQLRMQSLPLQARPSANDVQTAEEEMEEEGDEREYGG